MIANQKKKRNEPANANSKKLRRLTTTEVLTFYSRIFKNFAESFKTLFKNVHKTVNLPLEAALGLIVLS